MLGTGATKRIDGKEISAIELTARLLHELKDHIRQQTGMDIDNATFSIPVDFTSRQRRELREAAGIAGITVNSFVSESTAAYVGCLDDIRHYSKVAVFDWGGGTLDISVLEKVGTELKELAKRGRNLEATTSTVFWQTRFMSDWRKTWLWFIDSMPARDRDYLWNDVRLQRLNYRKRTLQGSIWLAMGALAAIRVLVSTSFVI